jgi:biotin operon repressor
MLKLLRLCQKYGVDSGCVKQIAETTGYSRRIILEKIDEYCIIPNLNSGLLDE